jgi:hypothetical protein
MELADVFNRLKHFSSPFVKKKYHINIRSRVAIKFTETQDSPVHVRQLPKLFMKDL